MNTQTGYITVSVTTEAGARPVAGAFVTVNASDGGAESTVYRFTTDESGQIPVSALGAPDKENSLSPEPDGPSYSGFRVTVSAKGYYTVTSPLIPVFSGILSSQQIVLVPLTASSASGTADVTPSCCHTMGYSLEKSDKGVYNG